MIEAEMEADTDLVDFCEFSRISMNITKSTKVHLSVLKAIPDVR